MTRPTHKELKGKLEKARVLVGEGKVMILDKAIPELMELGLHTKEELEDGFLAALNEATPKDYAGSRPPVKSYEEELEGCELFPFVFESEKFGKRIYLKIGFRGEKVWLVSLHRDKPK